MNSKLDIKSMTDIELDDFMNHMQEKSFRAKQVFQWIHQKNVFDYDQMSNLSKDLRDKLKQKTVLSSIRIANKYMSKLDGTIKYLFELEDHNIIESVLMKYRYGNTVCVSSQVGCRMGCSFCASTIDGLVRNLTAGEMLDQIYTIQKDCGERISNVVIMGSGEPLDNYEQVIKFIKILNSPMGIQIGQRHITLSTCGVVDKIYELAKEKMQITLAISLHAPNDELRKETMPVARKYQINDLLQACKDYIDTTNRRVTFEYALIKGINDQKKHAVELSRRLKEILCHVNLIPINEIKEREYEKANDTTIHEFAHILQSAGIETTVRRELGSDINAACGQLRKSYLSNRTK